MSLLIESLRLEEGIFYNVSYHQRRVQEAFRELFGTKKVLDLQQLIEGSSYPRRGLFKCRIVYDDQSAKVSFVPYASRPAQTLKLVTDNDIEYAHKFTDRSALDSLYAGRGTCDDVLIVRKGEVTDSSIANIVFRKSGRWFTPSHPLLAGTMRQRLLESGKIEPITIRMEQIPTFESFRLVNAMMGFNGPEQDVGNIIL